MTYYVLDGNWTSAVKNGIGPGSTDGINLFPISYSTGNPNPANGCSPQSFYANYKCGNETTNRSIPAIQNAVGKTARFDCADLLGKCSGGKLYLGDDGILTLKNNTGTKLWDSMQAPMNATRLSADVALALDIYRPILTNGTNNPDTNMPYKRSFLNSGEYLQIGQYMGSPNGACRLEMVDTKPPVTSTWSTVTAPYTTTLNNTLIRDGSVAAKTWNIQIISTSGFRVPPPAGSNTVLQISSAQGEDWITIGGDGDTITVPANTTLRYGSTGVFITKSYTSLTTISVPLDLLTFDTTPLCNEAPVSCATVPANTLVKYGANNSWKYKTITGAFVADNGTFGGDPIFGTWKKAYKSISPVSGSTTQNPNILQIRMSISAQSGKSLQVVYNIAGCSTDQPIDAKSSTLFTIPWTSRENLGRMGYVNELGQLQAYTDPTMVGSYSSNFSKLTNADGSSFGMLGSNLGAVIPNVNSEEDCQKICYRNGTSGISTSVSAANQCAGFEYEKIGKTCQLKGDGILTSGIRYNNPMDNSKNYEYYARSKGVKDVDTSCPYYPEDVVSGMTTDWNGLTLGSPMTKTTKCGLLKVVGADRTAVGIVDASLNSMTEQFSDTINSLYAKYQTLKDRLLSNKTDLSGKLNELNETKQSLADWSGEQAKQLDAINEDRDLNMMSQNYKHIMWSILAILIIIVIIKIAKSFGIVKTLDITKAPEAVSTTATAAVST